MDAKIITHIQPSARGWTFDLYFCETFYHSVQKLNCLINFVELKKKNQTYYGVPPEYSFKQEDFVNFGIWYPEYFLSFLYFYLYNG